jgi:SAM-dependent methyltransferase
MHEVFAPTSGELLRDVARLGRFRTVLDLGCGPGLTTGLLREVLDPASLAGIDLSATFLEMARREVPGAAFVQHDLLSLPFPGAPADLLYGRYVLTHLPDPGNRLEEWATQLTPNGLTVLEDNEGIDTTIPVFSRYLELAGRVIASGGGDLYLGRAIEEGRLRPVLDKVREASPPSELVARMFRLNLSSWRVRPAAQPHRDELDLIDRELQRLERSPAGGTITWRMRQLALSAPTS